MKKQMVVMTVVAIVFFGSSVYAQELIPEFKLGKSENVRLTIKGFAQMTYSQEIGELQSDDELIWTNLRPRLTLSIGEKWEIGANINFADFQEPNGNWLREAYVAYRFDEKWKLSVGRVFVAGGYSTPAPFELETVNYPMSDPFGSYAWGALLEGKFGQDWSLKASVSGDSGYSFSDDACWNNLEFSARLEKGFQEGSLAATIQASRNFCRVGTDFTWKPMDTFYLRTGLAYTHNADKKTSNRIGGYVIGVCRPAKWFEFHSQLDGTADIQKKWQQWELIESDKGYSIERVEYLTSDEANVVWTNGIRFFAGKGDMLTFTADYETSVYGNYPDRFLVRAQFRF